MDRWTNCKLWQNGQGGRLFPLTYGAFKKHKYDFIEAILRN